MSTLVFGNPLGLWALLAIPAVLAIHFLQPRSRRLAITTLFLLEHLPPLATTGRAWRWLRSTWALWLQLTAVLLITWLLCEPRWQRADSVQTIVVLLDASASMRPFRDAAEDALESRTRAWERRAARTEWIIRETHLERPVLFRGFDRTAALASLVNWRPDLGHHDFGPSLEVARQLVRRQGAAVLLSDRAPAQPLEGVALLAVGEPLENVGFAGGSVEPSPSERPQWTILVQHHGSTRATRTLTITSDADAISNTPDAAGLSPGAGAAIQHDELTLEPGQLLTLTGAFPEGVEALTFALTPDVFDLDDTLPLVVPVPRPLTWRAIGPAAGTTFFQKFLERTPGLSRAASGNAPDISIYATNTPFNQPVAAATLVELMIYTVDTPADRVVTAPVVSDSHSWIDDLTWSGLLGPGPATDQLPAGARALLWQGEHPLAWIETVQSVPRLVIGWNWPASNAERLPASAVLLHRVIEDARARKFAPETRNVDAGQLLHLPRQAVPALADGAAASGRAAEWRLYPSSGDSRRLAPAELATARAPSQPGFFEIRRDGEILLRAAAQFADPRETDFAAAATLAEPAELPLDITEANSERDHLRPVWLLVLIAVLLGSWVAQAPGRREAATG